MAENEAQGLPVEPPRGMYPARLDDKGRLKLPTEFQRYLAGLPEKRLFVTSVDRHIATIYPISIWRENEKLFESYMDDPEKVENVTFNAAELGTETEMDNQGRVQFSTDLRRELGIENQPVRVRILKGVVHVLSERIFEARRAAASTAPEADVKALQKVGFK
jgi:MraZ protein